MEAKLTKELAQKLMKIEGECRGMHLKNDADFILKKKGKEGLKKVEEELEKVGVPIKYREIKSMDFYPVGWRALSLLAAEKAFGWQDKEIRGMCGFATVVSLIVRIYMKFFPDPKKMVEKGPKMWDEYYTKGKLIVSDYDLEKKHCFIELREFELHPVFCRCAEGYLESLIKMIVKAKEIECRETKCIHKGENYHQYKITWE